MILQRIHRGYYDQPRGVTLIGGGILTKNATVTRASEAWDWGSDGLIYKVAANTPIIGYNPATLVRRGTAIRKAWTNSLLDNRDPRTSGSNWSLVNGTGTVTLNATGADGVANKAATVTEADASQPTAFTQPVTIADDSNTHTATWLIKKDSDETRFPALMLSAEGGTRVRQRTFVNTKTGALSNETAEGTSSVVDSGSWWKVILTVTNNSTGNTALGYRMYPAAGTSLGTFDNAATGSIIYDFGGVYLNSSYAGPPIETGASAVTREADDIEVSSIPFYSDSESTILVTCSSANGANGYILSFDDGSTNNQISLDIRNSDTRYICASGGVNQFNQSLANNLWSGGRTNAKLSLGLKLNDSAGYDAGTQVFTDTGTTMPVGVDVLQIGRNHLGAGHLEGWLDEFTYYGRKFASAQLESQSS